MSPPISSQFHWQRSATIEGFSVPTLPRGQARHKKLNSLLESIHELCVSGQLSKAKELFDNSSRKNIFYVNPSLPTQVRNEESRAVEIYKAAMLKAIEGI